MQLVAKPTITEAIQRLLNAKTHPDLASRYHPGMEVQINVKPGEIQFDREKDGHKYLVWSDGINEWKNIRIPYDAGNNPSTSRIDRVGGCQVLANASTS